MNASRGDPLAAGIAARLVTGKPLGVVGFSFLAVRLRIAQVLADINWKMLMRGG